MIRHICMFKLQEEANGAGKEENLTKAVKLSQILNEIPTVSKFEIVTNHAGTPENNYDLSLIIDFEDIQALEAYKIHPKHIEFGNYIHTVRESRACIDYELKS